MAEETYPQELEHCKEHDWVRAGGDEVVLGTTWFAQDALGEIVDANLPVASDAVMVGAPRDELESVKAAIHVFAPVSGKVIDSNKVLQVEPQRVNDDCHGQGWLPRVRLGHPGQIDELMDADDVYRAFSKAVGETALSGVGWGVHSQ